MYESVEELDDIQQLLDRSYLNAGAHLRAVLTADKRLSARELCKVLSGVNVLDLATVSPSGAPMVAPVDGLFYHGRFYFGSAPNAVRIRHIRSNPAVSAACTIGIQLSILVHGTARIIDTGDDDYIDLHAYFREVYGSEYDDWGVWDDHPHVCIEPSKMFATLFDPQLLKEAEE